MLLHAWSHMEQFSGDHVVLRIELGSAICKASALSPMLSLQHNLEIFFRKFIQPQNIQRTVKNVFIPLFPYMVP